MDKSKIKRILILFMWGIGNMVMFTPTLKAIRKGFPKAKISLLILQTGSWEVIRGAHYVDEVITVSDSFFNIKNSAVWIKFIEHLRQKKFDLTISPFLAQTVKTALLCLLTGSKYRIGFNVSRFSGFYTHRLELDEGMHEVERNLALLKPLGLATGDHEMIVHVEEPDFKTAKEILTKNGIRKEEFVVGIHVGAQPFLLFKMWDLEKFASLADSISERWDSRIIFLGGKSECESVETIRKMMKTKPLILTGKLTLKQTAALISLCDLVVTTDSGPMHIAAAMKTKTAAIFGPTNPVKNHPWHVEHVVIREDMDCSPCYNYGQIGCREVKCLQLLSVDKVLEQISRFITKKILNER